MSASGEETSPKKGKGLNQHTTVTTTTSNGFISKAMIKFLHHQSLKVSNTKNLSNIQVSNNCYMYKMYSTILNK